MLERRWSTHRRRGALTQTRYKTQPSTATPWCWEFQGSWFRFTDPESLPFGWTALRLPSRTQYRGDRRGSPPALGSGSRGTSPFRVPWSSLTVARELDYGGDWGVTPGTIFPPRDVFPFRTPRPGPEVIPDSGDRDWNEGLGWRGPSGGPVPSEGPLLGEDHRISTPGSAKEVVRRLGKGSSVGGSAVGRVRLGGQRGVPESCSDVDQELGTTCELRTGYVHGHGVNEWNHLGMSGLLHGQGGEEGKMTTPLTPTPI